MQGQKQGIYIEAQLKKANECEKCYETYKPLLQFYPSVTYLTHHNYSLVRLDRELSVRKVLCPNCIYCLENNIPIKQKRYATEKAALPADDYFYSSDS